MICAARCRTSTFLFLLLLRTSFLRMASRSPTCGAFDRDRGPKMIIFRVQSPYKVSMGSRDSDFIHEVS